MTAKGAMDRRGGTIPTRRTVLTGAGGLFLASTGIGSRPALAALEEDALVAAAKKEGRGMLYTASDTSIIGALLGGFKAKYGIDVGVQRLTASPLAQRFVAEMKSGNYVVDVFSTTDQAFAKEAGAQGWLAPIDDLPAMKDWPKAATDGKAVAVGPNPYSLVWNTNLVPQGLKTWEDILDPKWAGRVLVADPRVLQSPLLWYSLMRKTYGDRYLAELGKLASFSPSVVPGLQQVAAGAMAIYAPATNLTVVDIMAKHAPVDSVFAEPTVLSQPMAGVFPKAPHPNIARLLVNYWITPEGQALFNRDGYSRLTGVANTHPLPRFVDIDPIAAVAEGPEITKLLGLG